MPIRNAKELFVSLLSRAQQGTERTINLLRELSAVVQNQEIEEALEARAFVAEKTLATLDEVFAIIDERPVTLTGRLHDVFAEEFHKATRGDPVTGRKAHLRSGHGKSTGPSADW